jgi:gliding motility-associated-like protein
MNSLKRALLSVLLLFFCLSAAAQSASFDISKAAGCAPFEVKFTNTSTGRTSTTKYSWDFGDFKTSADASPSTTYDYPGTYTVKLTVTYSAGSSSTKTATITVYKNPSPSFTSTPAKGCPCTEVTFTNTSKANEGTYTSKWSFGDGEFDATNSPKHLYCLPGSYNIGLQVTNTPGCNATRLDTAKVLIHEPPKIAFTANKTMLCRVPDTVLFTSSPSGGKAPYTFFWDFGDSYTSSDPNPKHGYIGSGTFTVKLLIVDANGCRDSMVRKDYISTAMMIPSFTAKAVCVGATSTFTNTSSPTPVATRWIWPDGSESAGTAVAHDFLTGGPQTVIMIDNYGSGCIDTVVRTYTMYPKPKARFSYDKIYPCPAPVTINFTNYSSGADSFLWIFGDRSTSRIKSPAHTYTYDSIFTVFMIAKSSYGCLDTFRVRDTSKPFPQGYPSPYYDSFNSPVIIRIYDAYTSMASDSAGGCMPFVFNPRVWLNTGQALPQAIDSTSCSIPPFYPHIPYKRCPFIPGPDRYDDEHVDPYYDAPIEGNYPYPIRRYRWDFGGGDTSSLPHPTRTYTTEGVHWVRVTVWTDSCSFSDSMSFTCGTYPLANFTVAPAEGCKTDSIVFTNASHNAIGYIWFFGDGDSYATTDSTKVFSHKYKLSDTFSTILTANRYGCLDTMAVRVVIHPPQVAGDIEYSCDTPLAVRFIDGSEKATSVRWLFGDGNSDTARNARHVYATGGDYNAYLIAYNATFGCTDTMYIPVNVYQAKPEFYVPDTTLCLGDSAYLIATEKTYLKNFSWYTNGRKMIDTFSRLKYRYTDTGTFNILLVCTDTHNCLDSVLRTNYVLVAKPQMNAKATPLISCAPASVVFVDSSTNTKGAFTVNRFWNFGDGGKGYSSKRDTARGFVAGNYGVWLTVTDNIGCKDSILLPVESRKPQALFTTSRDTFACVWEDITFNNISTGTKLSYQWDFGDGGTSGDKSPKHAYRTIGTFNIKLIITDDVGCKDSILKLAYIKTIKPSAGFIISDSVILCPPLIPTFKNLSAGAINYFWDFGNGSRSLKENPGTIYNDTGNYKVMLVAKDKWGCTDTAWSKVKVFGYDGAITYDKQSGCAPLEVNFESELINAEVMIWDYADGVTESAIGKLKTTHVYRTPGAYLPRLILGDGKGCSASSRGLDTIWVDGVFPAIDHTPACINTEITFDDISTSLFSKYGSSLWTFDDGTQSTEKQPKRIYTTAGTYRVTLQSTNTNGCSDTISQEIEVFDLPVIKGRDTIICLNDGAKLTAEGGIAYTWAADPTLSCTACDHPIASPRVQTDYIVTGRDGNGCTNVDTLTVGIKTKTTLMLDDMLEICARTPVQLQAKGAYVYAWSPSTYLSDPRIANPIATINEAQKIIYTVIGYEGSCEPDTAQITIVVHPLPEVNAGPDQKILSGSSADLSGSGMYIKDYLWAPSATLSCADCPGPVARPQVTTTYTLYGYTDFGCSDSDKVTIIVFCDNSQLFIPNTFTPNGDGQNDYFYPYGKGVEQVKSLRIFNRWGQLVFEKNNFSINDKNQGWDGTFKGEILNPDTFVYTLEATCENGETVFWKGDITIIR